jgi:hypothetical protein
VTIAEVTVKIQVALPQGWTSEAVSERVEEILEGLNSENHVVEWDHEVTRLNNDPFNERFHAAVAKLPESLGGKVVSSIQPTNGPMGTRW